MPKQPGAHASLSPWLTLPAGALIAVHLAGVLATALAAPSGPWGTMEGRNLADPPLFVQPLARVFEFPLTFLHLTHHYHFASNHPGLPGVSLEASLSDQAGNSLGTVRIPEDTANPWARDREASLVRLLADDQPVEPPQGEVVAAPGRVAHELTIWEPTETPGNLTLLRVEQNLVPRNRPVFRPSERSLALAASYARYLCRRHGAATVVLVRHTRSAFSPLELLRELPREFDDLAADFGKFPR